MRRWVIAAIVLLGIVVAGAVALLKLTSYLNRNKDWLEARAGQVLGRDVQFTEIGVSLTRGLGVRVRGLRIADDPAFSNEPVLSAADAIVRIRILPALLGRYEIARIVLDEPVINVIRTKAGLNLSTFGASGGTQAQGEEEVRHEGGTTGNAAVIVAYLTVDGGTVHFLDRVSEPAIRSDISRIDFSASDVSMDRPLTFRFNAAAFESRDHNVHANGTIGPFTTGPGKPAPLSVDIEVDEVAAGVLQRIPPIAAALPAELYATGPVSFSGHAQGTTEAVTLDLSFTADDAHVRYATLVDKAPRIPLHLSARAKATSDALTIGDAKLTMHTAELRVNGSVSLRDISAYDLVVTAPAIALPGWERVLPAVADYALDGQAEINLRLQGKEGGKAPNLRGTIALRNVGARGQAMPAISGLTTTITLDGDRARVEPVTFMLAGAPAKLTIDVKSLRARSFDFGLAADDMHLGAFAPGASAARTESEGSLRNLRVDGAFRGTVNGPDAHGHITSTAGTLGGLAYQNLAADFQYANSRAVLDPISLATMGGTVRGHGVYELHDQGQPTFQFDSQLHGVRIGDFAAAFAPAATGVLEGNVDADVTLTGSGESWDTISRALTGHGRFGIRDGVLEDINLVDGVLQGLTGLPGLSNMIAPDLRQKYPQLFATNATSFDALQGNLRIAGGKLSSDDLSLSAADYAVNGRGGVGFDRSIDVAATLALSQQLSADLVRSADVVKHLGDKTGRLQIPFKLVGTLPRVRPRPDIDFVAQAVQRAAVQGFVDRIIANEKRRGPTAPAVPAPSSQTQSGEAPAQTSPDQPRTNQSAPKPPREKAGEAKKRRQPSATEKLLQGVEDLFSR